MRNSVIYRTLSRFYGPLAISLGVLASVAMPVRAECLSGQAPPSNSRPVQVLSQLDIDGDGLPDAEGDTDGDGLPDNWEASGPTDTRFVNFSAPTGISPGTPATFITVRLPVTTDETLWDTDGDGLSDFIEVFGLKYIDDNGNNQLDFVFDDRNGNGMWDGREPFLNTIRQPEGKDQVYDLGEPFIDLNGNGQWDACEGAGGDEAIDPASEWMDFNRDGLPSIGEYPLPNVDRRPHYRDYDFDGFVFTDPRSKDTDADGADDCEDRDPLINPSAFGLSNAQWDGAFRSEITQEAKDQDLDNDGLGDLSDFGNDLLSMIDYPTGIANLIQLFRPDRLECANPTIPESLLEDISGGDWNGDGLFRITDVRDFRTGVPNSKEAGEEGEGGNTSPCGFGTRFNELFYVGTHALFAENPTIAAGACETPSEGDTCAPASPYGARGRGLGWQPLLLPTGRSDPWFPDVRIWAILYAWRVPGFDIDGNGYIGSPERSFALDDRHLFVTTTTTTGGIPRLDGVIEVSQCGNVGAASITGTLLAFVAAMVGVPVWRRRSR